MSNKKTYIDEAEAIEWFDDYLNGSCPQVEVLGLTFEPAQVVKEMDPIAYDLAFSEYCSEVLAEDNIFVRD